MIALFKRPARRAGEADLPALVARIDAMEAEAQRIVIDAYAVQIRELARAAEKELAEARMCAADIPGDPATWGNLGEGYWEVALAEVSAKHVGRYAREARHWLHRHTMAVQRLKHGQGMEPWSKEDRPWHPIAVERCAMEAAQ